MGMATGSGRMRLGPGVNNSLAQRVALLENQYASLFNEVGTLSGDLKTKTVELQRVIDVERGAREQEDLQIRNQLRKAVADGIPLSAVGALCFFAGIAAGTASPEIALMFGYPSSCQ